MALPDQRYLNECFLYDKDSGLLLWKARPSHHFSDERYKKSFNTRYAGKPALSYRKAGYMAGSLDNIVVRQHRVIWKMVYGEEPGLIDHKDRNGCNNSLSNLRKATVADNNRNCCRRKTKQNLLPKGVHPSTHGSHNFVALIGYEGRTIYLGSFENPDDAAVVYRNKAKELFGEFYAETELKEGK